MNQEGKSKRNRLGILDICILTAILLCVVGAGARLVFKEDSVLKQDKVLDTYTVYYSVNDIRQTSFRYFYEGAEFYIDDSGDYFGKLVGKSDDTPALKTYVDQYGDYVQVYNTTEDDRVARIDVVGTFAVSATMDDNGYILLNGNTYIAPNKELLIRSKELLVNIRITSIVKAN